MEEQRLQSSQDNVEENQSLKTYATRYQYLQNSMMILTQRQQTTEQNSESRNRSTHVDHLTVNKGATVVHFEERILKSKLNWIN